MQKVETLFIYIWFSLEEKKAAESLETAERERENALKASQEPATEAQPATEVEPDSETESHENNEVEDDHDEPAAENFPYPQEYAAPKVPEAKTESFPYPAEYAAPTAAPVEPPSFLESVAGTVADSIESLKNTVLGTPAPPPTKLEELKSSICSIFCSFHLRR